MKLVSQTPVTPGQPSTATVLGQDENGNVTPVTLDLPPGKAAAIPDNVALKADLTEFVSGTFGLGRSDLPGIGLHVNGNDGSAQLVAGSATDPVFITVPTMGYLLARLKNGAGAIKSGVVQNCSHGSTIAFPQAYADDNVVVIATVNDGGHARTVTMLSPPNRNGFQISLNYWNGSGLVNETLLSTIYYIAIGAVQ